MNQKLINDVENNLSKLDIKDQAQLMSFVIGYCTGAMRSKNKNDREFAEEFLKSLLDLMKQYNSIKQTQLLTRIKM
ncbi:hypothetical protein [Shimazuella alba]|uniref:Uncharacterized protein n=1 Tax=Shimazuella alba TaxID=2690964 RepID=A0A6I4VNE3_9BACL|nr:hypothetical protein [Shimazuella alba]MXQ53159.1 hypothetical protein [Shimazuella alba]